MFFTDIFTMWFNFTIDDDRFMPIELDVINTTVPLEIIFYKNGGLDNDGYVILGDVFSSELLLLDLTFTIEGKMPLEYFFIFLTKEYIFTKNWINHCFIYRYSEHYTIFWILFKPNKGLCKWYRRRIEWSACSQVVRIWGLVREMNPHDRVIRPHW